jgi:membrane-associated protease RseP (regulator of RpoE activity)
MRHAFRCVISPVAALLCCCAWTVSVLAVEKNSSYQAALESIKAEELGDQVGRLADASMEGREAGTRGGRAAADYLAEQYARLHLRGGADNGAFLQPFEPNFHNVLAILDGSDPKLREQVIVVGAHYDHLGYGGQSYALGPYGYIHPGADDNASGTSAVWELAKAFTVLSSRPKRSIIFAAWDAEEKGLLGSKRWAAHPTVPLEHVVAALNLDMIGRLREEHLIVLGSRSGYGWRRLLSSQNESGLWLDFTWNLKPNADHYAFFEHGIPVLMVHTGLHDQYHRPSDAAKFINSTGMTRVTRLLFGAIYEMAEGPVAVPGFRAAARHESPETEQEILGQTVKPTDRLGVTWIEAAAAAGGVRVSAVKEGSPAQRAGLREGDRIVRFAGRAIRGDDDFFAAVATAKSPASLVVQRPGDEKSLQLKAELAGSPLRWGIMWRVDDAEPRSIILTYVVPGSPAALAGLAAGDRIYQVAGRDFADEAAFAQLAKTMPLPLQLLVERDGRLRIVVLQSSQSEPIKRAA